MIEPIPGTGRFLVALLSASVVGTLFVRANKSAGNEKARQSGGGGGGGSARDVARSRNAAPTPSDEARSILAAASTKAQNNENNSFSSISSNWKVFPFDSKYTIKLPWQR